MEYLAKIAESKCPGAEYAGIAFDSERPTIELVLPNEGKDIQDLPLTWTLPPDGRSIQASIKDFSGIEAFVPPESGSDEAYEARSHSFRFLCGFGCFAKHPRQLP